MLVTERERERENMFSVMFCIRLIIASRGRQQKERERQNKFSVMFCNVLIIASFRERERERERKRRKYVLYHVLQWVHYSLKQWVVATGLFNFMLVFTGLQIRVH